MLVAHNWDLLSPVLITKKKLCFAFVRFNGLWCRLNLSLVSDLLLRHGLGTSYLESTLSLSWRCARSVWHQYWLSVLRCMEQIQQYCMARYRASVDCHIVTSSCSFIRFHHDVIWYVCIAQLSKTPTLSLWTVSLGQCCRSMHSHVHLLLQVRIRTMVLMLVKWIGLRDVKLTLLEILSSD